ncbi:MAG: OadG family protein [Clostridia bacterium]|nr:OadG family protein [Clostridia bacterium]
MFEKLIEILPGYDFPALFVVALGIGTVFVGLVCIVLLCKIVSLLCKLVNKSENDKPTNVTPSVATAVVLNNSTTIENRQEIIAAVSVAIAEELGTDVSAIKIHSLKRI